MYSSCHIRTSGKWVLTGEHAVLRGRPAIAFPLASREFVLDYAPSDQPISTEFAGEAAQDFYRAFQRALDRGIALLSLEKTPIRGHFKASNTIPVRSGMGASAALCVSLARWFMHQKLLDSADLTAFATELEHLFHGQSSGLDIASVQAQHGIVFQQGHAKPLSQSWYPNWTLSYCGETGITADCIASVKQLQKKNPALAEKIDQQMQDSSALAVHAFRCTPLEGIKALAKALDLACDCFSQWGLISPSLAQHMEALKARGALGCKPTGSGAGGYVISLWAGSPPSDLLDYRHNILSLQGDA